MPLEEVRAADAWRSLKTNAGARWSSGWEQEPAPGSAWARLREPFFSPMLGAGFPITLQDEVFAIGSCFARGVEAAFHRRGFTVASLTSRFDQMQIRAAGSNPAGFTNKYNPWSIANELEWAFETGSLPPEAVVQIGEDLWFDPHATPIFVHAGREETLQRHQLLTDLFAGARRCRVITITLGLIEAWHDRVTGLYANANVPGTQESTERFSLRVLTFAEVTQALERIHSLLAKHCPAGHQVIVTVSPVPLEATFTGRDVVIANSHSKALLRAAAAEWCARHDNLHYFPSYEIVTSSDRALAWRQDGRHVRDELVQHIMDVFTETYLDSSGTSSAQIAADPIAIAN